MSNVQESKEHSKATPAYKKAMRIANSARPQHDGIDTRCKLNSKAAHMLRKHNDKFSQQAAVNLFMENYEMQCKLRGSNSPRAIAFYVWAIKTEESYIKANMRHKVNAKKERLAQKKRDEKNNMEKNVIKKQ